MSRQQYDDEWERDRQQQQRLRRIFVHQSVLSPIREEFRTDVSRRSDAEGSPSPLPELVVEWVPGRAPQDDPEEYYNKLVLKIKRYLRKLATIPAGRSYADIHDGYDLSRLVEVPSETTDMMNEAFISDGSGATFVSERDDGATPQQDMGEEAITFSKSNGSGSNTHRDSEESQETEQSSSEPDFENVKGREPQDDDMGGNRGTEAQGQSDENNNQPSEDDDDANSRTSSTAASLIIPTRRTARADHVKNKQAAGPAEAELQDQSNVAEPMEMDEHEVGTLARHADSEVLSPIREEFRAEVSRRSDAEGSLSPLPELVVEWVPRRAPQDDPEEYYNKLVLKIKRYLRKLATIPAGRSYADIHDGYDLSRLVEVPSETTDMMNEAFISDGSGATFVSERDDGATPQQDMGEEAITFSKSNGSGSNTHRYSEESQETEQSSSKPDFENVKGREPQDDDMGGNRGTEAQGQSDENNNQPSEDDDDANSRTSSTAASLIIPTRRTARADHVKNKQAAGPAEAELQDQSNVAEPMEMDEHEVGTLARHADSEGAEGMQGNDGLIMGSIQESEVSPMSQDGEEEECSEQLEEEFEFNLEENGKESHESSQDTRGEEEKHIRNNESLQPEVPEFIRAGNASPARGSLQPGAAEVAATASPPPGPPHAPVDLLPAPAHMEVADESQEHFHPLLRPSTPLREEAAQDTLLSRERSGGLTVRSDDTSLLSDPGVLVEGSEGTGARSGSRRRSREDATSEESSRAKRSRHVVVQTEPVAQATAGVQTVPVAYAIAGVQIEPVAQAIAGVQTESVALTCAGVQTESVAHASAGMQTEPVAHAGAGVQTDDVGAHDARAGAGQTAGAGAGAGGDRRFYFLFF